MVACWEFLTHRGYGYNYAFDSTPTISCIWMRGMPCFTLVQDQYGSTEGFKGIFPIHVLQGIDIDNELHSLQPLVVSV